MTSADLIAELQSARPVADPVLREHVRAIAAAPPAARRSPFERLTRLSPRRVALVAVPATAVVVLGLAGVGALLGSGSEPQSVTAARESAAASTAPPATGPALKAGAPAASDAVTPAPTPGRAQRVSAQLTLSVKDVDALSDATQQALRVTRDLGGYLVTVSYATSDTGTASLTLKVPTAKVQDAITRLTGLGTIVSQQVQIDDLQGQVDELTRQETALLERIARLSARIAAPETDAETRATLQARRDAARAELSRVRTARAQVNAEARYATIQLNLQTEQSSLVPAVPSRWDRALDRAQEILVLEATVALTILVVLGPVLVLVMLAWLARKTVRRRRDDQLLAAR
jgi:hypothetical protein